MIIHHSGKKSQNLPRARSVSGFGADTGTVKQVDSFPVPKPLVTGVCVGHLFLDLFLFHGLLTGDSQPVTPPCHCTAGSRVHLQT